MQRSVIERAVNVQDSVSASKHVKRAITEPTVNVSDSVTLLVTRFKQSPNVTIEEKLYDGIPSLQFSADHTNIVINNSSVKISLPESKTSQNISSTSIWKRFQSIFQEVKEDSSIDNKDELLSLLENIVTQTTSNEERLDMDPTKVQN